MKKLGCRGYHNLEKKLHQVIIAGFVGAVGIYTWLLSSLVLQFKRAQACSGPAQDYQ